MIQDFLSYVAGEWNTITQAPLIFLGALIVCAIIIWKIQGWRYSSQIDTRNTRLQLKDDQLSNLQEQLHATSPSDALVKIGELTAKVEALSLGKWDPLSEQKTREVENRLREIDPAIIHLQFSDADARAFAHDIWGIFDRLKWDVTATNVIGFFSGIEVSPKSDVAEAIADALRIGAQLDVSLIDGRENKPLTLSIGARPF